MSSSINSLSMRGINQRLLKWCELYCSLERKICNVCQVEKKKIKRFWIGSELLRFDKPALKGAFRPHSRSPHCSQSNMSPLSSVLSNILSAYIHTHLSWHIQYTSPLLYAKPEETFSAQLTLKPKQRDQFMNRFPLCSRSKPLLYSTSKSPITTF